MSLDKMKTVIGEGARPNKYQIVMTPKGPGGADGDKIDTLAKSASLPDVTVGTIDVWNQGRKLVVAGDVQYSGEWTVSFYNTVALELRKTFEDWIKQIDDAQAHTRTLVTPGDYMTDIVVSQLDGQNNITATFIIYNAWPKNLNAIELADETADQISTFDVNFAYSHWQRTN